MQRRTQGVPYTKTGTLAFQCFRLRAGGFSNATQDVAQVMRLTFLKSIMKLREAKQYGNTSKWLGVRYRSSVYSKRPRTGRPSFPNRSIGELALIGSRLRTLSNSETSAGIPVRSALGSGITS